MRTYDVYMLRCFDGTFYVGVTNDVERRLYEHCSGTNEAAYTFTRRPLHLVFASEFTDPIQAIAFEKQLKGWSHRKKRAFAEKDWRSLKKFSRTDVIPSLSRDSENRADGGGPSTSSG